MKTFLLFALVFTTGCNFELFKAHQDPFYAAMLATDKKNPAALYSQGRILLDQGRYDQAEDYFEDLVKLQPDHLAAWNALGRTRLELGKFKPAQAAFERQIALRDSPEAQLGLASALLMQGNIDEAKKIADNQQASSAGLERLKGDIEYRDRNFQGALQHYEQSLALNSEQPGLVTRIQDLRDFLK